MRKMLCFIPALVAGLLLLFACSSDKKKDDAQPTGPSPLVYTSHDVLGTWVGELDVRPLGWATHIGIALMIDSANASHLMFAVDSMGRPNPAPPPDTVYPNLMIFRHLGPWSISDNVVHLVGDTVQAADSTTGQLVPVDTMTIPITVSLDSSSAGVVWNVKVGDLWPFFSGLFSVPADQENMVKSMTLGFVRQ